MEGHILIRDSNLDFGTVDNLLSLAVDGQNSRSVNAAVKVEVTVELLLEILQT